MAWSDFLGEIDWGGVLKQAVPAAINYGLQSNANQNAAQAQINANQQAATQIAQANANAAAQIEKARQESLARTQPLIDATAPAIGYLQRTMADQGLSPEQQQRVMDTRRETANMLASRLGGRSATAIATRAAQGLENSIYDQNLQRSDRAATGLAGYNVNAINAANQVGSNAGVNLSNLAQNTGQHMAGYTGASGNTAAGLALAQGANQAGLAGSVMAPTFLDTVRSVSAEDRKSNYDKPLKVPGGYNG